ncbi:Uncharacterised protein [Mycobacteroides abscessus]|nr:Uncharacterised protein [Mycobacteroides abscessus]
MSWSKPPAASTTPRLTVTVNSRPARATTAPVTRPPAVVRRTSEVPVQIGIPARSTPAKSPAASA